MIKLELASHALRAQFNLPDEYHPMQYHAGHLALRCHFPDLKPERREMPKTDETIDLQITLQKSLGRAEHLINGDGPVIEPAYLRQMSCLEPIGRYQIYQEERIQTGIRHTLMSYVFFADDGAVVGVEDPGEAIDRYQYSRKIGKFVHVQSSISKEFGDDFIDVDLRISDFIKTLLIKAWEIDPDPS